MCTPGDYGFRAEPRGDNLYIWDVYLDDIDETTPLGKDMTAWAKTSERERAIHMEMIFPTDYPLAPPFLRVLRPRFKFLTGHITIGGSICMQLLTTGGWSPANTIESVIVQVGPCLSPSVWILPQLSSPECRSRHRLGSRHHACHGLGMGRQFRLPRPQCIYVLRSDPARTPLCAALVLLELALRSGDHSHRGQFRRSSIHPPTHLHRTQVRTEILSDGEARLQDPDNEYTMRDARSAFDRMCRKYGW